MEPKGPTSDLSAKKSSKKRPSGPPQSIPHAPIIPRLVLADPKLEIEPTAKAAKKRASRGDTSHRESTLEEDAEKQARREAKKQRAEEKRREQVAVEEAQRLEEQRLREARIKDQSAVLNADALECQEEAEEYEDDGFEQYDDDFDAPAEPSVVVDPLVDEADVRRIQQALQAETKGLGLASTRPSEPVERRPVGLPSLSLASSLAGLKKSLDPRAKRVKDILEHRKFEIDKMLLFQQNPVSELDQALARIRRGLVRHALVQTSDGVRTLGLQTKPPITHDQSMHFPDDVGVDTPAERTSSTRWFQFLELAAFVCETLVVDNVLSVDQALHSRSLRLDDQLIFPPAGVDMVSTLAHGRELVALHFSPSVSSTLVSCYGPVGNKLTTVSCVWDINVPSRPLHVLENVGVVSTVCLSPTRDLFVVVGTQDGTLHVWDLRPRWVRSVRSSPAFSTYTTGPEQHEAPIVALEAIADTRTFQLGAMDDRGIVTLWSLIELNKRDGVDQADPLSSTVKLVLTGQLDVQKLQACELVGPALSVLKFFPHEPNQFLVGSRTGELLLVNRLDQTTRMQYIGSKSKHSGVVAIDFHPFEPKYFLAGYEDGQICLFHTEVAHPLTSWTELEFGVSVCAVLWSPARPAVFFASYSNGSVLVWDLLACTSSPTWTHEVAELTSFPAIELASSLYPLVLSSDKMRTSRPAIAWRLDPSVSPFQFTVFELGPDFSVRTSGEQAEVAQLLQCIL